MPYPLAVGIFQLSRDAPTEDRRRARIEIGLCASREGYALLDTFDMGSWLRGGEDTLDAIRSLTDRHDLHAVIVIGNVDQQKVNDLADERRLITVRVPVPKALNTVPGSTRP
jgi:hypothetical protein